MITFIASRPSAKKSAPLPPMERAGNYLAKLPSAIGGERGHDATFRAACVLVHGFALEAAAALDLLRGYSARCVPPWSERELVHKVNSALGTAHRNARGYLLGGDAAGRAPARSLILPSTPNEGPRRWPELDGEQRAAIIAGGDRLHELQAASPVLVRNADPITEQIIDALFPDNPWLCVGTCTSDFKTRKREDLRGQLASMQFIVPSPMTGRTGRTQDGRESEHTLANTGPRRFLVIEQDTGTEDEQAAVIFHLAEHAPLALVAHSGGKSMHAWLYCHGQEEERLRTFMRYAVSLGADKATWTRSQFVRMPDGTRENGMRQTLWFYNPAITGGAQ